MQQDKRDLREAVRRRLAAMTPPQRALRSADVLGRLFALPEVSRAGTLLFYVATGHEVQTSGMIAHALAAGKRVAVPRVDAEARRLDLYPIASVVRDLAPGFAGILEPRTDGRPPLPLSEIDLAVVPGVAFDAAGCRLGRGGGYYDRWIAAAGGKIPIVGLAFECQIADRLPVESHDRQVGFIVTEKRIIACSEE